MFFQVKSGLRELSVTGGQTCALPIYLACAQLGAEQQTIEAVVLHRAAPGGREAFAEVSLDARDVDDQPVALLELEVLDPGRAASRSEEHTSELQSQSNLVCRPLPEQQRPPYTIPNLTWLVPS